MHIERLYETRTVYRIKQGYNSENTAAVQGCEIGAEPVVKRPGMISKKQNMSDQYS